MHILYGDWKDTRLRVQEIDRIAGFLARRAKDTGENIILLGDFNNLSREDDTFAPLDKHGWHVPLDYDTNVIKTKAYDQIAFLVREEEVQHPTGNAFDFFESVFRDDECDLYFDLARSLGRPMEPWDNTRDWKDESKLLTRQEYYQQWRTWQMSDHMPLWAELKIDFSDRYLEAMKRWTPPGTGE